MMSQSVISRRLEECETDHKITAQIPAHLRDRSLQVGEVDAEVSGVDAEALATWYNQRLANLAVHIERLKKLLHS